MERVDVIFCEDYLLRIDSAAASLTILKRDGAHYIRTSHAKKENSLLDYAMFRVRIVDDALCHFHSRDLTLRESIEFQAILYAWPECNENRLWRFLRRTFPEYAELYVA